MAVSENFRDFVLEQLGRQVANIRFKRMFGGGGVYSGDVIFALLDDDQVYLKGDAVSRPHYEAAGWPAFAPMGEGGGTMSYYAMPGELLEDDEARAPWVQLALETAHRKAAKTPRRKR